MQLHFQELLWFFAFFFSIGKGEKPIVKFYYILVFLWEFRSKVIISFWEVIAEVVIAFGERSWHLEFIHLSRNWFYKWKYMLYGSLKFLKCIYGKFELSFCVLKMASYHRTLRMLVLRIPKHELGWNKMTYFITC